MRSVVRWRCLPAAIVCELHAVAAADVPHGSYSHTELRERASKYVARHSSFEVSYTGAVMVDKEEWILEGEFDSSWGVEVVARRPKSQAGLSVDIHFRASNGRGEGKVELFVESTDKKSRRCGDVRMLSGTYRP